MGSCEIRFLVKQDYHILNPLPSLFHMHLAETKVAEIIRRIKSIFFSHPPFFFEETGVLDSQRQLVGVGASQLDNPFLCARLPCLRVGGGESHFGFTP